VPLDAVAVMREIAKVPRFARPDLCVAELVFGRVGLLGGFPMLDERRELPFGVGFVGFRAGASCCSGSFGRWSFALCHDLGNDVVTQGNGGSVEISLAFVDNFVLFDDGGLHKVVGTAIREWGPSAMIVELFADFADPAGPFVGLKDTTVSGEGVEPEIELSNS
jgi:hypothetical protein